MDEAMFNKLNKYIADISNKEYDKNKSKKGLPPK